ncbi:MAG: bifunctional adenosylcobinamide kinase/adenosylcobinamide-phosphate guanylyltransferase [Mogibacterium sp.]|nr:bifunctional adenosylcobinamide kinase/adenosylcobinamide-phosphate guanylyltransferase [Mogibacterium sp.]
MTILIIGFPNSGKSALAEQMAMEMSEAENRIYLATMIPFGNDGKERVKRHRSMRAGKGFLTVEAPFDIRETLLKALPGTIRIEDSVILLECLSNLAANEMFERRSSESDIEQRILADIAGLGRAARDLIIVSNHFENDGTFDEETLKYAAFMDELNDRLEHIVDRVIRVDK